MNPVRSDMFITLTIRTADRVADLPPALKGAANLKQAADDSRTDYASEIQLQLENVAPDIVARAVTKCGFRIARHFLWADFKKRFWDDPTEDCVGAFLAADGYVETLDPQLNYRIVPLAEPFYTSGRPIIDSEHARRGPNPLSLSHLGGIQAVSDELLFTLRSLGAQGETAPILYRGSNQSDSVQPGYKRFLPQPEYVMASTLAWVIEFLPSEIPADFGICSIRRHLQDSENDPLIPTPFLPRNVADDTWYDIALTLDRCRELRRLRKSVLLTPIFRDGGATHAWVCELKTALDALKA